MKNSINIFNALNESLEAEFEAKRKLNEDTSIERLNKKAEEFKTGDKVDVESDFGEWLETSEDLVYTIERLASPEEVEGIYKTSVPCFIVKLEAKRDDKKFLNNDNMKVPVTKLRHSSANINESAEDDNMLLDRLRSDCEY